MRAGRVFRAALSRRPWAFHLALMTTPAAWSSFVKFATGRSTYPEALRKRPIAPLLRRLAR